jgi:ABC-type transport system involved in multi-copper enzyme maturation permease subunit
MLLLKIEWLKLKKYTTFWVLTGLFLSLYILWNIGANKSIVSMGSGPVNLMSSSYSFPNVWSNMGFIYSWFVFFLSILMIISISNEFSFKTHRQNIIDGLDRLDFLHGKAYLILSISLLSTLLFLLLGLLFGMLNGGGNPLPQIEKVGYVFLYTLNYLSFAALIAFFIRRSGMSIVALFAYLLFETIFVKLINWKFDTNYGNLFPLQSSDELLPLPIMKSFSSMVPSQTADVPVMIYLFASVCYIALYYMILRKKIITTDL